MQQRFFPFDHNRLQTGLMLIIRHIYVCRTPSMRKTNGATYWTPFDVFNNGPQNPLPSFNSVGGPTSPSGPPPRGARALHFRWHPFRVRLASAVSPHTAKLVEPFSYPLTGGVAAWRVMQGTPASVKSVPKGSKV